MAKLLVYYAHPGQRHSRVNRELAAVAAQIRDISFVDLYATYPRFEIDIDREQALLDDHDVVLFQFPLFWYSTPSLVKEWLDLVLEHGFAYGSGGDRLSGKRFALALTAAGPEDAYTPAGYQHYPLRTFLSPLEQTARLCHMEFVPPYVLYGSLRAPDDGRAKKHIEGYRLLLESIRDDRFDFDAAAQCEVLTFDSLPVSLEKRQ